MNTFELLLIVLALLNKPDHKGVPCLQADHDNLSEIIDQIKRVNEVQEQYIGEAGHESENYKNYIKLIKSSDTQQLLNLTDHENEAVASYAGWGLISTQYNKLPELMNKFLRANKEVATFAGCVKGNEPIADVFYFKYWNLVNDKKRATDKALFEMDSLIIYSDKADWVLLMRALENRVYPESYNQRIKYLASEKHSDSAGEYLKRWSH